MFSIPPMMNEYQKLSAGLVELKQESPQRFGYLERYWGDAKEGLNNTPRNYAQVAHIYENIPEPEIGTRGLGHTLVLLAELDVITVLTNRSNATIYDLTGYRPERLEAVGRFLD